MYTVINMMDMTDYIAPDNEDNGSQQSGGISFSASLSDPNSTWDFVVDDIAKSLNIQNFWPVIVFDENASPTYTIGGTAIPTVPTMNFARNPSLNNGTNWTTAGTLAGQITFLNGANNFQMTFSNNVLGSGQAQQQTLAGYVQPGVQYSWAAYLHSSGAMVNVLAFLQVTFQDINGNTIGSPISQTWTPTTSFQHVNITATAPAGAVYAFIALGGQTTVGGTNSGTFTWGTSQFEPMWFLNKGITYPTPDCNFNQVNSVLMPDGTTSRKCRLFAGYVEDHKNFYVGGQRHTAVQCASSAKLLETAGFVSASYTNTVDSAMIADAQGRLPSNAAIIGQFSTGQQNLFSPTSTLIAGVTIDSISFNDATMREVCNGAQAQSGSLYFMDAYYYLWYVPPSFVGTTVYLSDNPDNVVSFPYHDFSVEYDSTNPANTVRIKGSKQKAAAITDNFTGDGSTTTFSLSFPPENTHTVTVGGTSQRTGVDGVDNAKFGSSLTYKALINKQRATIQFATAPANASAIVVSYTYEDQVISDVIGADAVANQKAQFWGLVSDSNITSTKAAKNRGLKELTDYAFPRTILTLSSLGIYIPVGGLIFFTCASEGMVNQPFVVQTVDSDLQGAGIYRWNYTAGVYNPTLIDHIRNVHKAVKRTPTTANVVVIASIDVAIFDSFVFNDSVVLNNNGAPSQGPYLYGPDYLGMVKDSAPLRYYRLNEPSGTTATDSGSQGQNGTINGGVTLAQTGIIPSVSDTSMLFNGSTGYISVPASSLTAGHDCSIEMWVKISSFAANSRLFIDNLDGTNAFQIALQASDQSIVWAVDDVTGEVISSHQFFSTNTLYHIVGTWIAGTRTAQLYVNGVAQSNAGASGFGIGSTGTNIGRRTDNTLFFNGTMQGVTLYNFALSSGAISARYNAGISNVVGAKYGFASYS